MAEQLTNLPRPLISSACGSPTQTMGADASRVAC
jgi:hypothetical protein